MTILQSLGMLDLNDLLACEATPRISIYVPTAKAGRDTLKGSIILKNLLREAQADLKGQGLSSAEASDLIGPCEVLIDDLDFWQRQSEGLAIFLAKGLFRTYQLPISVPERQLVGDVFDIVPLLPMLYGDGYFYVLALSENEVRLFRATRYRIDQVHVPGIPESLEALDIATPEKQQQRHGGASGPPTYFGSGSSGGPDAHKDELKRFFDRVDSALTPYFNRHPAPVVLAGVDYLLPIYRSANTSATILEGAVSGNQDRTSDDDIHRLAWAVAAPHFAAVQDEERGRLEHLLATGGASADAPEIEAAAGRGRVETLFIAEQDNSLSANRAAIATITQGGKVFIVPADSLPQDRPLAATFRY